MKKKRATAVQLAFEDLKTDMDHAKAQGHSVVGETGSETGSVIPYTQACPRCNSKMEGCRCPNCGLKDCSIG